MSSPAEKPLDPTMPVQFLKGCGAARAELLARLRVRTVRDLLFCFPRTYQDLTELRAIEDLEEGVAASVLGTVEEIDQSTGSAGRSILGVLVRQGSQHLRAVWFNQPFLRDKFHTGEHLLLSGRPKRRGLRWEMVHPIVKPVETDGAAPRGELLPVYRLTEGLNQRHMRSLVRTALEGSAGQLEEVFPAGFLQEHNLLPLVDALPMLHFPSSHEALQQARRRFVYQELFVLQLALALKQAQVRRTLAAYPLERTAKIDARIRRLLPFELTPGQNQAIDEIAADLGQAHPMNRLLQGEVGSGKTIVAVYAMLLAVAHGAQAVLMAPTEVLARQHVATLERLLAGSKTRIGLLTGGFSTTARKQVLAELASGDTQILVGTHAVLADDVAFQKLALVVIDEQHKFGVRQRARLKHSVTQPHYLVMTATPIPRTVSMTLFGDLDLTTLTDRPPGRQSVHTYLPPAEDRDKWWEFFRKKLRAGRQGYVIVPLVSEQEGGGSPPMEEDLDDPDHEPAVDEASLSSVDAAYEALAHGPLDAFRLGLVHGRMSSDEKIAALESFRQGETQVLVATTVIEVGIDVPNATLMTIENAERFGLAQLHQLRGRISRGSHPGYCCLFAGNPTDEVRTRLQALVDHEDGFQIAEIDFQLRGPGDLLGTRQHGLPPLRIANLQTDTAVLHEAQRAARTLVAEDPELAGPEFERLRRMALVRYGKSLALGDVG